MDGELIFKEIKKNAEGNAIKETLGWVIFFIVTIELRAKIKWVL